MRERSKKHARRYANDTRAMRERLDSNARAARKRYAGEATMREQRGKLRDDARTIRERCRLQHRQRVSRIDFEPGTDALIAFGAQPFAIEARAS